ncbi:MAG: hypothetical protein IJU98_02945 [Synergistaceae bacterium]|nr:hypothetical protein [Synergistaceae bacterium]
MPRLIAIEGHEGQRRQLEEQIASLKKAGYSLSGKFEAGEMAPNPTWRALFENAGGRGLFAERQALVAEGAEALGAFPEELSECLESEEAETVVIATFGGDTKKIFPKSVLSLKKITLLKKDPDVPPWKRRDWLLSLARQEGLKLAADAAALLGESIESLEELRGELSKLGLYAGGREISLSDVRSLSFDEGARAQLVFLDGVCQAQARDVARSLRHLSSEPLLPVLTGLCNRLRPALFLAAFPRAQEGALRAIGMGTGKDYALRMARSALSCFGPRAIEDFMMKATRLSFMEKTSLSEGWPGFELILWELMGCAKRQR